MSILVTTVATHQAVTTRVVEVLQKLWPALPRSSQRASQIGLGRALAIAGERTMILEITSFGKKQPFSKERRFPSQQRKNFK
jgi:hypothetical protein